MDPHWHRVIGTSLRKEGCVHRSEPNVGMSKIPGDYLRQLRRRSVGRRDPVTLEVYRSNTEISCIQYGLCDKVVSSCKSDSWLLEVRQ